MLCYLRCHNNCAILLMFTYEKVSIWYFQNIKSVKTKICPKCYSWKYLILKTQIQSNQEFVRNCIKIQPPKVRIRRNQVITSNYSRELFHRVTDFSSYPRWDNLKSIFRPHSLRVTHWNNSMYIFQLEGFELFQGDKSKLLKAKY